MKGLKYIILVPVFFAVASVGLNAQTDRRDVRKGNRDFRKENYREAEIDYRKALVKDSLSFAANYNLGNTLYRSGDMEQARKSYEAVKESAGASVYGADYYYNMGNAAVAVQDWQGAVEAYIQSLLRNPGDLDAKENYIYAREMLKNNQNNQNNQNQNQDNQDNQDNKDNQNDRQNQDGNDDKDKKDGSRNPDDRNGDSNQDRQPQPQDAKITPQAAQQMLRAIQAKEKETQEKVNKEKAEAMKSRQKEKNW
ncbi:MAG: tetratricopeptide repeat protein [Bacteroidales bacterium]|nr:tetratricopeptide repeat protein [Bacteroidales bacterium]